MARPILSDRTRRRLEALDARLMPETAAWYRPAAGSSGSEGGRKPGALTSKGSLGLRRRPLSASPAEQEIASQFTNEALTMATVPIGTALQIGDVLDIDGARFVIVLLPHSSYATSVKAVLAARGKT
jgi:hypothetical protein